MGKEKGGFLTPKAIANRIKSKGLQKLKWYCQMCNKQCRDENGFKCHLTSESHQRQLLLFADNPNKYMDDFSKDFLEGMLDLMKRQFGGKRVNVNVVYQDYIKEKDHVHMNSTQWHTLTGFVQFLGREGLARVDNTEKGWFAEYIDRDPIKMKRQEASERESATEEEKMNKFFERQMQRDKSRQDPIRSVAPEYTGLIRENPDEKIMLKLQTGSCTAVAAGGGNSGIFKQPVARTGPSKNPFREAERKARERLETGSSNTTGSSLSNGGAGGSKRGSGVSALDEIMAQECQMKEKKARTDFWLKKDIVVKLISSKLPTKFHKKKARVVSLVDKYSAIVELLDTPDQVQVDQDHVETVIPSVGRLVVMVNGIWRGELARLKTINIGTFSCNLELTEGSNKGKQLNNIPYEDLSKLFIKNS